MYPCPCPRHSGETEIVEPHHIYPQRKEIKQHMQLFSLLFPQPQMKLLLWMDNVVSNTIKLRIQIVKYDAKQQYSQEQLKK